MLRIENVSAGVPTGRTRATTGTPQFCELISWKGDRQKNLNLIAGPRNSQFRIHAYTWAIMSGKAKLCVRTHQGVFTGVNMYVNRQGLLWANQILR